MSTGRSGVFTEVRSFWQSQGRWHRASAPSQDPTQQLGDDVRQALQCRLKAAELLRRETPEKLGSTSQQKQKFKTALALLEKRALDARIRRALPVLWAVTTASRLFATGRLP